MATLIIYLIILSLAIIFQRKLLYLPGIVNSQQIFQQIKQLNLKAWPSEQNYFAITDNHLQKPVRGTIIVFHGNAGTALDRRYYFDSLTPLGYRVILAEYPGYGGRAGSPSEQTLIADGIKLINAVANEFPEPIILWGESLGTGVATGIIKHGDTSIDAIVLMTPFTSMSKVAQHHYWFLFAGFFLWDRYDNISNLSSFNGKVAVLISEKDEIIPHKIGKKLYDQIKGPKRLWVFKDANHNNLPLSPNNKWWQEVLDFIN